MSIVVPLCNERDNIRPLYETIRETVVLLGNSYELIFVDDGSHDGTLGELRMIQHADPALRVIKFRRNFGQTAAMRAGIQIARGRLIVTLDGDLQNDPRDIPKLLHKIDEGYDLVVGWRRERRDSFWSRTLPSRIANLLIRTITGVPIHDGGCSLKAYRAEMIKRVPLYSEMHRFIPALSTMRGARIAEVAVVHHPRTHGNSKYGLSRVGRVLLDVLAIKMLITFRHRPLHWFCALAVPFWVASLLTGVAYAILRSGATEHPSLLVAPVAFLWCIYLTFHFLVVGLLAELVIRTGDLRAGIPGMTSEHVNAKYVSAEHDVDAKSTNTGPD